eukprot:PhM_4_TR1240/c0_g1_i1/m.28280
MLLFRRVPSLLLLQASSSSSSIVPPPPASSAPSTATATTSAAAAPATPVQREFMKVDASHVAEYLLHHPKSFTSSSPIDKASTATDSLVVKSQQQQQQQQQPRPLAELLPGSVEGVELAYVFQETTIDTMKKQHRVPVSSWLLGPTSRAALKQWNVHEPFSTPVFQTHMLYCEDNTAPQTLNVSATRTLSFDLAFTFRLARDVPLFDGEAAEDAAAPKHPPLALDDFDAFFPTILFSGSRFPYRAPHVAAHVSDLCGVTAMAVGSGYALKDPETNAAMPFPSDLSAFGCVLTLNTEPVAIGRGASYHPAGPVAALSVLRDTLMSRGRRQRRKALRAGTLLCLGSCTTTLVSVKSALSVLGDARLLAAASPGAGASSTLTLSKKEPSASASSNKDEAKEYILCGNFGPLGKVSIQLCGLP